MASPSIPVESSLSLLETQVLLVLSAGELHGYAIATELQRRNPDGPRIFPTNLYRRLHDLADRGLITNAGVEVDDNGRARKNFSITDHGRDALRVETERLASFVDELRSQIAPSPGSASK